MRRWYVDTSAALKLIVREPESSALAASVNDERPDLVACDLLETELRRAAQRDERLGQDVISDFLDGVDLFELPRSLFLEAGLIAGGHLRSVDALHLAAAIRIGVERIVTYDARMVDAARSLGMDVMSPGMD